MRVESCVQQAGWGDLLRQKKINSWKKEGCDKGLQEGEDIGRVEQLWERTGEGKKGDGFRSSKKSHIVGKEDGLILTLCT